MSLAKAQIELLEPDHVITGMAQGWDMEIASACAELRVPFTAAIPFWGQEQRWHFRVQERYASLLTFAANVRVLHPRYGPDVYRWRDEWMVDRGDLILALFDESAPTKSGTGMTVRYANRKRVPVLNCWKEWLALGHAAS